MQKDGGGCEEQEASKLSPVTLVVPVQQTKKAMMPEMVLRRKMVVVARKKIQSCLP